MDALLVSSNSFNFRNVIDPFERKKKKKENGFDGQLCIELCPRTCRTCRTHRHPDLGGGLPHLQLAMVQHLAQVQLRHGGCWPLLRGRGGHPGQHAFHRRVVPAHDEVSDHGAAHHVGYLRHLVPVLHHSGVHGHVRQRLR